MTSAVSINNLNVYYESNHALKDITLNIEEGEFAGIIGPNGSGKTTLIKSVLGLIPITSGNITIFGKDIDENRSLIGYVPQFAEIDKRFPISVIEAVMTAFLKGGLRPFFRYSKEQKKTALSILEKVGIEKLADRQISELSGGEFQRMLIARALAAEPKILLLDEPDASIDPNSREHIYRLLSNLNKEDITIILVTHDLMAISTAITSVVCLNNKVIYHGRPDMPDEVYKEMYGGFDRV